MSRELILRVSDAVFDWGQDGCSFFGATPISTQPASAAQAAVTATSTNGVAAAASADLAALAAEAEKIGDDARAAIVLVNRIRLDLVSWGLIKGAA
jgi:hypothetical protein